MTKLFVGGLPFATNNDELKSVFDKFGAVSSANVIMDKFSGRSRGFGFVEMENDSEAQAAIQALDGSDYSGRKLMVSVARPREERPAGDRNFGGGGGYNRDNRDSNFRKGGFDRGGRR